MATPLKLDPFMKLLAAMSKEITPDEFSEMKVIYKNAIPGGELARMNIPADFFVKLYHIGVLSKTNTSQLEEALRSVGRVDLVTKYLTKDASSEINPRRDSTSTKRPLTQTNNDSEPPEKKKTKTAVENDSLHVVLLMDEWCSSKGGIQTVNRHMAINLAKLDNISVTCSLDDFSESEEEEAGKHGVKLIRSVYTAGRSRQLWLQNDRPVDVIIGHSRFTGPRAKDIKEKQSSPSHQIFRVHVVHMVAEQLATVKAGERQTADNIDKQDSELELCRSADLVVAIGPHLEDEFARELELSKVPVYNFTPGLIDIPLSNHNVNPNDLPKQYQNFHVYIFGRGSEEDWKVKGFHIAAEAFAKEIIKKDQKVHLTFIGAKEGEEDSIKDKFCEYGVANEQLRVRRYKKEQMDLFEEIQKADLVIQPSLVDAFGLSALEAISIGKPVLVNGTTGFGQVLEQLANGDKYVVKSSDSTTWAERILDVRKGNPQKICKEVKQLQLAYKEDYNWAKSCENLISKIRELN
ncbi:D-inositol 3-phosphate glycosyltransferase-like [Glandiceps talaboti]